MVDIPGHLPRHIAVEKYRRSEQSFRRDFFDAVKRADKEFLANFKISLNDGTIIEGIEVDRGDADRLNSEAKQPVWHIAIRLLESRYWEKKRGKGKKKSQTTAETDSADLSQRRNGTKHEITQTDVVSVLQTQISDKNVEIAYLRDRLTEKAELERERNLLEKERNKREDETNQIMRELGLVLGGLKEQGILKSGEKSSIREKEKNVHSSDGKKEEQQVRVAEVIEQSDAEIDSEKGSVPKKKPAKRKTTRKKPAFNTKRRRPTKKSKSRDAKWYEMPTIKRFFSR